MSALTLTLRIVRLGGQCTPSFAMPKVVFEGSAQARRAQDKQKLGSLKQLTVQPSTRLRYEKALNKFLSFLLPSKREQLDTLVMEYIEHLWLSGEGRGLAADIPWHRCKTTMQSCGGTSLAHGVW